MSYGNFFSASAFLISTVTGANSLGSSDTSKSTTTGLPRDMALFGYASLNARALGSLVFCNN